MVFSEQRRQIQNSTKSIVYRVEYQRGGRYTKSSFLDPNTKSLYLSTDYRLKFYGGGEEQHAKVPQAEQLQMLKKIWEHFRLLLLPGV